MHPTNEARRPKTRKQCCSPTRVRTGSVRCVDLAVDVVVAADALTSYPPQTRAPPTPRMWCSHPRLPTCARHSSFCPAPRASPCRPHRPQLCNTNPLRGVTQLCCACDARVHGQPARSTATNPMSPSSRVCYIAAFHSSPTMAHQPSRSLPCRSYAAAGTMRILAAGCVS